MSEPDVTVREELDNCVLATRTDATGRQRRWWFSQTDAGRLKFIAEVLHHDDGGEFGVERNFVDQSDASIPDCVVEALSEQGWDEVVDTDWTLR